MKDNAGWSRENGSIWGFSLPILRSSGRLPAVIAGLNKAWLPEKSVEKLELAVNQEEEKTNFLKTIFGIHL